MKRKVAGSKDQAAFLFMRKGICFICMIWIILVALYWRAENFCGSQKETSRILS